MATSQDSIEPSNEKYNEPDRNAFLFGFTPQAELWNGRLAMLGFVICLLWLVICR